MHIMSWKSQFDLPLGHFLVLYRCVFHPRCTHSSLCPLHPSLCRILHRAPRAAWVSTPQLVPVVGPEGKDLGLFCRKGAEAEPKCVNGVREDLTASQEFPRTSQAISCFPGMRGPCSGKRHSKCFPDVSGRKTPWAIGSPSCPTPRVSQRGCRRRLPQFPFPISRAEPHGVRKERKSRGAGVATQEEYLLHSFSWSRR